MDSNHLSDESSPYSLLIWEVMSWLRRATLLLAADRSGLKEILDQQESVLIKTVDGTSARLLKAGTVLGLFNCDSDGVYSWSCDYEWARTDDGRWKQLIWIICHQLSYLNLIENPAFWIGDQLSPAVQLARDPKSYKAFLQGVAVSHRQHASWLSHIEDLKTCQSMADLGGGLGIYATAWVMSSASRRATIVDLPGVAGFLASSSQLSEGRVTFIGADLTQPFTLPDSIDFVLFANVLHLIPGWPALLKRTIRTAQEGCVIGIFEADPRTPQGTVFDLQVHLRSGRLTGLLDPARVEGELAESGLHNVRRLTTADPEDPFRRQYSLWIGEVNKVGQSGVM